MQTAAVIVFLVNVVLMTILSRQLNNLFHQANSSDALAQAASGPVVWATMLLANSPVLVRILFVAGAK